MKKNLIPLLGIAFIAAVVATGIFYGLLMSRLQGGGTAEGVQVLVASRALDRGSVLKEEDVRLVDWVQGKRPEGSFQGVEAAIGLTILDSLEAGQAITTKTVAPRGASGGASLAIPGGQRAVTLHPVDSGGVLAMLRSGSRVDIVALEIKAGVMGIRKVLQNVEVLSAAGQEANGRPMVTVLTGPEDAERVALADASSQLRLVLRNPAEKEPAVTMSSARLP